jgi:hypothetical protein
MTEIETRILSRQCLARKIENPENWIANSLIGKSAVDPVVTRINVNPQLIVQELISKSSVHQLRSNRTLNTVFYSRL